MRTRVVPIGRWTAIAGLLSVTIVTLPAQVVSQQPPVFRSRSDVVTVDVHVVDRTGLPVSDLRPGDFVVTVGGKLRRIVVADYVSAVDTAPSAPAVAPEVAGDAVARTSATSAVQAAGRTILLVVDEANIRSGFARPAMDAALTFADGADPRDRVGVITVPYSSTRVEPTTDRTRVKQALSRISGHLVPVETLFALQRSVGITEAFVVQNDPRAWSALVARECREQSGGCEAELQLIVRTLVADVRQRMVESARALTAVIEALGQEPGPKTLVLVSEELSVPNALGERIEFESEAAAMSAAAARAQVSVYVVHLPRPLFDVENRIQPANATADADDRSSGLETVTTVTGGRRFMVSGRAEPAFARILREISGHYVIGFEAETADRDGKPHTVTVNVARAGTDVRARRQFVFTDKTQNALARVAPSLRPAPTSAEPLQPVAPPSVTPESIGTPPAPVQPAPRPAPLPEAGGPVPTTEAPGTAARTINEAMARVARYVVDYGEQVSLVIAVERYSQWFLSPNFARPLTRQLMSEFAFVRVQEDDWLGFRDVFEVDGKRVSDRQGRLEKLLRDRSPSTLDQGRRIADESARYNLGAIQRNFNVPTTALFFLHPKSQRRFTYRKDGEEQIEGVSAWRVKYEEQGRPTIIRTRAGKDMPVRGTVWLDPIDGRVVKTHMELTASTTTRGELIKEPLQSLGDHVPSMALIPSRIESQASITVIYKRNGRLGMLLPAEMRETYEGPWVGGTTNQEALTKVNCHATYSDFKRFETSGRVVIQK